MAKTPDRFPGEREEYEGIYVVPSAVRPAKNGEFLYVTGEGFKFYEEGAEVSLGSGSGGGITESQHEALNTETHAIAKTSYDEVTYSSGKVTNVTTWTTSGKTVKVREDQITWTSGKVSQVITIQYDGAGTEKYRVTEDITYTGNNVTSITRTKA